ncbi:MAG: alpha/beta hydrolase, partial [Candidatus Dadabacteria bacterium]
MGKTVFRKTAWLTFAIVVIALAASVRPDLDPAKLEQQYAAAPSRFAEIGHWRVHYRDEGQGDPVVLVHGTTSSLHTWDGWTAQLKQHHRVIRMDLPAFG